MGIHSVLRESVRFGDCSVLGRGADPDRRNARGWSPTDGAAFKGDLAVLTALLDGGAQVDGAGPDGRTALMWAAAFDRVVAVALLLARGADRDRQDETGRHALDHARGAGAARAIGALER